MSNTPETEARRIAALPQVEGKQRLLELAGLSLDFGYDEGLRSEIHANLLYDAFRLAVCKGFTWTDVCKCVQLTEKILQSFLGQPITQAFRTYQEHAAMTGMENRSLAIFTDYFFGTFMQHYKLYQYIFTTERDQSHFVSHITIETPLPPMALGDGQPPVLHEYESKLKKIQERRKEVKEIDPAAVKPVVEPVDVESCSQTEAIKKIITSVMTDLGNPMAQNIAEAISSTYHELDVRLDETSLPRPKQLGTPPRYQIKPTLPMPKVPAAVKTPAPKSGKKSAKAK